MTRQAESGVAVAIGGPTASGKSALAVAIAREFGGTVINADSMQLYDALPILTAQPSAADRAAAPHALYGVLPADAIGSAQRWREMAEPELAAARQAGRLPVVVGGTGLYLRTLLHGLSAIPEIPPDVREGVRALWREAGGEAVRRRLAMLDPEAAARLAAGDRQRLQRALEVVEATGRPLSAWQKDPPPGPPDGLRIIAIALLPPRGVLREAIAGRFMAMVAAGAIEEAHALVARGLPPDRPILRAVGLPQLARHVAGEIDLDQAVSDAILATGQYAKRQQTWFKRQFIADWTIESQLSQKNLDEIFSFIRRYRLTGSG